MSDTPNPTPPVPATPPSEPAAPVEKQHSTEEVQRIAAKEAREAERALLAKLGFKSEEEAAAFTAEVQKRQEAEKTELQRAQEAATAKSAEVEEARRDATAARFESAALTALEAAGVPREVRTRAIGLLAVKPGATQDEIAEDIEALKTAIPTLFATTATEAPKWTPDSAVQGKPPVAKPLGDDPWTAGAKRAEEYAKRPGYNPLA